MKRLLLVAVLLVPLVGTVPLAHASPPDPTWIGGLYDDGDYDDVVLAAISGVGAVGETVPALVRRLPTVCWQLEPRDGGRHDAEPATAFKTRAPPLA